MGKFKSIVKKKIRPDGYSSHMLHNIVGGWWNGNESEALDIVKRLGLPADSAMLLASEFDKIERYLKIGDIEPSEIDPSAVDLYLNRKNINEFGGIPGDNSMNYRKKR